MKKNIWNFLNSRRSTYYIFIVFLAASVVFSSIYYLLPNFDGNPALKYKASDTISPMPSFFECLYFSITSQTKVGYGDIIPASNGGKITAMAQITFGYFYLAFIIAFFVSKTLVKSDTFKSYFLPEKDASAKH